MNTAKVMNAFDSMDMQTMDTPMPVRKRINAAGWMKKFVLGTLGSVLVAAMVAQVMYTFSGTDRWESLGTRKGVTVYERKTPGSNLKKFKAVWRVKSTLSKFVMFAQDEKSDLGVGYYDIREFEPQTQQTIFSAWKAPFPKPFRPREFVIKNEFWQDTQSKELFFRVTAAPDRIPPDKCCVRVSVMNNSWKLTPLQNGEIEIEWLVDMDLGVPYFLANKVQPQAMYNFGRKMQGYLDRDTYKNAKYDWIQEVQ